MRSHDPDAMSVTPLESFPPMAQWDDWVEYDAKAWPKKVERRYTLVPTTCFNCEAACGLVAYVDKTDFKIQKLEGNPHHPGSRGKNCAKGPATKNQIEDPGRILYPLKRVGPRGSGKFERTTWDHVLDTFAAKIRAAIVEGRKTEVMYHVGRPGHDGYMDRVLQSWGVDGHNSHTNVCSAAARLGYALWTGSDRPSPDHENSKFMLLLPHLLVQALLCGSVVLLAFQATSVALLVIATLALLAHWRFAEIERRKKHHSDNARQAAAFLGVVRWGGIPAFGFGMWFGVIAMLFTMTLAPGYIALPVLLGLYVYKYAYVRAAQLPPLS